MKQTILIYESKFHSFFNDLTTFGFIILTAYLDNKYLSNSIWLDFVIGFIVFTFILAKAGKYSGIIRTEYSKELAEILKDKNNDK